MKSKYKSKKIYYYRLAKAGSYWGKKLFKNIGAVSDVTDNELDFDKEEYIINSTRRQHSRLKENTENLKAYDVSILIFIKKWVVIHNIIPFLAVPFIASIFYLPFFLLGNHNKEHIEINPSSEKFIVTEEFIDQATTNLQPLDNVAPSPPTFLSLE